MGDGIRGETRIISLNLGEHLNTIVQRFQKDWHVQFVLGESLLGRSVRLFTSMSGSAPLPWTAGSSSLSAKAEVVCCTPGSYTYEFFVDDSSESSGSGFFLVDPQLSINQDPLPLDAVLCQTHLVKLLGPLPEWESRLRVAAESGYNMIHFTPIHALGISNSSYSIRCHYSVHESLHTAEKQATFDDVSALVGRLERELNLLSVQDVVWNHAAKNAEWLQIHPESAYNCWNSPHLRPAYVMDRLLHHFGRQIGEGLWADRGIPAEINSAQHIESLNHWLSSSVLPSIRVHEFFQIDVPSAASKFHGIAAGGPRSDNVNESLCLLQSVEWKRLDASVDWEKADRIFNRERGDAKNEEERVSKCVQSFTEHLEHLNEEGRRKGAEIEACALNACLGHIRYERVEGNGPRLPRVSPESPLTCDYFLHKWPEEESWEEEEKLAFSPDCAPFIMAFNGWVMNYNPLDNFALPNSAVYLRRELVCWGDSVKLNYGEKPDPNSFLWQYMETYTMKCAEIFHGLRIDNAHSTPIHVAEYLLSVARRARPNLFVFAELFTGSEEMDNLFVNRLGVTSLIREAQAAGDSHEQGRLVFRYGGDVVGAMQQRKTRPAEKQLAHAFLFDQTHDNPSPIQTRSVLDVLPSAAMVSMASCAVGSTRGYDELVPYAIHVVNETRLYPKWGEETTAETGIIRGRALLNALHAHLAKDGYSQVFVDQMTPDVVAVTRHSPTTHSSVVVVSHTAFGKDRKQSAGPLRAIPISGRLHGILFEMTMELTADHGAGDSTENEGVLRGLREWHCSVKENVKSEEAKLCRVDGGHINISDYFPSGSVVAFQFDLEDEQAEAVSKIRCLLEEKDEESKRMMTECLAELNLQDLQRLLFACADEEKASTGLGPYHVPNHGDLLYCGLQGLMPILAQIRAHNDLGHPLCANLRDGLWLADYVHGRLRRYPKLTKLAEVMKKVLEPLYSVPFYLRPCYFEAILSFFFSHAKQRALSLIHPEVRESGDSFEQSLALSAISFVSHILGAGLPPLPPSLAPPENEPLPSLAAGLPHFSAGIWRNWGRDTFIALPGCLLTTGRYSDAKATIIGYAGTLRHGLIPNLLAEGIASRFNCRDAVWFWLHAVAAFVDDAPDGADILHAPVRRLYPSDEAVAGSGEEREEPLWQTMFEALSRHWNGISFRERNAGPSIDEHMKDEGFNVKIWVDRETGFVHGGNRWNCGTWMDKMGSSEKAGNKGEPATPRDGAPVELQALAFAVLTRLQKWHDSDIFPPTGVQAPDHSVTWNEWATRLSSNFESEFFVADSADGCHIHRRGILKDTVGSSLSFPDFQLRPNFCIALAVAPQLVQPVNSWRALNAARNLLLGPIGMKTLDPSDWAYNGMYNNDDDGFDKKTAKGWNYHQGPEWVWVAGFYLLARLAIGRELGQEGTAEALREVQSRLGVYRVALKNSPWRSIPELTQAGGLPCPHSCPAQAWSVGLLLQVCRELRKFSS